MIKWLTTLAIASFLMASSCNDENTPVVNTVTATKSITVNFSLSSNYTFFRFSDSSLVPIADSATNKWDFAMRRTNILINSNASGPGLAGAQLVDGLFNNLTTAPEFGYGYDTTATRLAIKDGSWYDYNSVTRTLTPKAGKLLLFKTASGNQYAKLEFLSSDYAPFVGMFPTQIIYRFRYSYQPSGSRIF
jgi:hypothetical protein